MINIHARSITDELTSLVKQLDELVAHPKDNANQNRSFVVILTDDPDAVESQLQTLAKENGIENIPLTVYDGITGPRGYNINQDAEVTVMMWKGTTVAKNAAFAQGELDDNAVQRVLADAKEFLQ